MLSIGLPWALPKREVSFLCERFVGIFRCFVKYQKQDTGSVSVLYRLSVLFKDKTGSSPKDISFILFKIFWIVVTISTAPLKEFSLSDKNVAC